MVWCYVHVVVYTRAAWFVLILVRGTSMRWQGAIGEIVKVHVEPRGQKGATGPSPRRALQNDDDDRSRRMLDYIPMSGSGELLSRSPPLLLLFACR